MAALGAAGLIDEYQVFIHPVLLGTGRPLYPQLPARAQMVLVDSRVFDGSVVGSRYARNQQESP
ncbi:hypothetical protein BCD49_27485 [Pseudofrankia sp. EUN1h]|nr:hypothetical protein BCD49_27485 [Pseudofrankia sp. EUN1h]